MLVLILLKQGSRLSITFGSRITKPPNLSPTLHLLEETSTNSLSTVGTLAGSVWNTQLVVNHFAMRSLKHKPYITNGQGIERGDGAGVNFINVKINSP